MNSVTPKRIGIAIVEHRGAYLIGTRGPDSPLAGYAEFPGGKCRPDESAEACAVRECREETHLQIVIDRLLQRCEFTYPHATVDLHFFLSHPADESQVQANQNGFAWIPAADLASLRMPDANAGVLKLLANQ